MPAKKARDRLIRLATSHPQWALGFEDETWWSRLAQPALKQPKCCESIRNSHSKFTSSESQSKTPQCWSGISRRCARRDLDKLRMKNGFVAEIVTETACW
jgi:hypothetical protein